MFPISRDERLKVTIGGIEYHCIPPVGDIEDELINYTKSEDVFEKGDLAGNYSLAVNELEKDFKGKKRPKLNKWNQLITERMTKFVSKTIKSNPIDNGVAKMNDLIDKLVTNWVPKSRQFKGTNAIKIAKFPKDNKPSQLLTIGIKTNIISWYFEQFNSDDIEESKN